MKITTRDAKLLYILGGLLLFLVVYMYVFTPMQEKTAQMKSEIESLEQECKELEMQYTSIDAYQSEIKEYRTSVKNDLNTFPVDVKEEDIVAYLLNLEDKNDIELLSVEFTEPVEIANFTGVMQVAGEDVTTQMVGKRIGTIATAEMSYAKFKNVLDYIYASKTQTTLESVTVTYDSKKKVLNGSFDFSRYILTYDGAEYTPEKLPSVTLGQDDLFQ